MYLLFLVLVLLLLFIININKISYYYSILCIIIIIFAINNTQLQENYKNNNCPKWENKCYNRTDCGWCIDKNINGKCVKGKINGPKNKSTKKCSSWWYKGKCVYGLQCPKNKPHNKPSNKPHNKPSNPNKDENWEELLEPKQECIELDEEDMVP